MGVLKDYSLSQESALATVWAVFSQDEVVSHPTKIKPVIGNHLHIPLVLTLFLRMNIGQQFKGVSE